MSAKTDKESTKNSIARGVISNWAAYLVLTASGFVMPRLISDRLGGQEVLGIWDFAWSLAAYTHLLALGISSACSRFVARYRKLEDDFSLNLIFNTCLVLLIVSFVVGCVLVLILRELTPSLIKTDNADSIVLARRLVVILGISGALQLVLGLFNGILTGCQRFDLKNIIRVSVYLCNFVAMIISITLGRGLITLACLSLIAEVVIGVLNIVLSWRLCPQLRIKISMVTRKSIRDVLGFGGKTVLQSLSRMGVYQTSGIIVSSFMGPAVLAVYARQRALVSFVMRLMSQYGNVFTPQASALHSVGQMEAIRALVIKSARFGFYVSLPIVVAFTFAGKPLLNVWMGSGYSAPGVLAILAIGHLGSLGQRGVFSILAGMNRHGLASLAEILSALGSVIAGIVFVGVAHWGQLGAAVAVALAVTIGGGLAPAWIVCRTLDISLVSYLRQVILGPVLAVLPLVTSLLIARILSFQNAFVELGFGLGIGAIMLVPIYWRFVLTDSLRRRMLSRLPGQGRAVNAD